jgi:hypothetical protein
MGAGLLIASDTLIGIGITGAGMPGGAAVAMATYLIGLALVIDDWTAHDESFARDSGG